MKAETQPHAAGRRWPWAVVFLGVCAYIVLHSMGVIAAPFHLSPQTAKVAGVLYEGALVVLIVAVGVQSLRGKSPVAFYYIWFGVFAVIDLFDDIPPLFHMSAGIINISKIILGVLGMVGLIALGAAGIVVGQRPGRHTTAVLGATLLLLPLLVYAVAIEFSGR